MAGNDQRHTSVGAHQVGTNGLPGNAGALELTQTWQSALQQLYKQAEIPQSPYFPAGVVAAQHPYAQLWASQPALMYGAQMFGGVSPYGFLPGMAQNQSAAGGGSGRIGPASNGVPAIGSSAQESGAVRKHPPRLPPGAAQPVQQPQVESQAEPRRKRRKQEMPRSGVERTVGEEAEPSSRSGTPTPSLGDMSQQQAMSRGLSGEIEAMSGDPSAGGRQGVSGVSGASDWRRQRAAVSSGGGDGDLGSGAGIQDEREVKKLRRKQSNRDSARRSRLRKQAECEALTGKVKDLQQENGKLKTANKLLEDRVQELTRLMEQRPADRLAYGDSDAFYRGKTLSAPQEQPAKLSLASKPSTQGTEYQFTTSEGDVSPKEAAAVGA